MTRRVTSPGPVSRERHDTSDGSLVWLTRQERRPFEDQRLIHLQRAPQGNQRDPAPGVTRQPG
ncbi:MAG TPA: hypothetical protein VG963_03435 [Polyangiaceae bacterium]|nr:hypothetical protein [Polyangiaceae bacterium]